MDTETPISNDASGPSAVPSSKRVRSVAFVIVVGGVLATFLVLGSQGRPRDMPATDPHKLQLNLKGELVGVFGEAGLVEAMLPGVEIDKRATENRVNVGCTACHGAPGVDPSTHACGSMGRCLPANHPPKPECIKCHRMPSAQKP